MLFDGPSPTERDKERETDKTVKFVCFFKGMVPSNVQLPYKYQILTNIV